MKKLVALAGITLLTLLIGSGAFAQESKAAPAEDSKAEAADGEEAAGKNRVFLLSSWGHTCSWLTRIIKQTGRSNFVFEDFLVGLYYRMDLHTPINLTPMARLAAFYPLTSTFNKYPQEPKTPLHYSLDMNMGINFNVFDFAYFRLNAGPAMHLFFLNSDRWNYFEVGGALFIGMELPLSKQWTLIGNGFASLDNGNLGGNRGVEIFDIAYQYQVDLGVRYSRRLENKTYLFPVKSKVEEAELFQR
jgi:hypothetical protein